MCDDNDEKYQTKETARGFVSSMFETDILLEIWSCVVEQFHKTSQALQDSKMTLNRAVATNEYPSMLGAIQELINKWREENDLTPVTWHHCI